MTETERQPWHFRTIGASLELVDPAGEVVCDWNERGPSIPPSEEMQGVIAASLNTWPKLLKVCKQLVAWGTLANEQDSGIPHIPVLAPARAAIAEAETTTWTTPNRNAK